jgi:hypothetical protein
MSSAEEIARAAKLAFETSQLTAATERVCALRHIKQKLEANKSEILAANAMDLEVQHPSTRLWDHSLTVSPMDAGRASGSGRWSDVRFVVQETRSRQGR